MIDTTTDPDVTARRAARDSGRHPAGRRLAMRTAVATLAAAGMLAAGTGAASARPVPDTPVYCGPGYTQHGAVCIQNPRHHEPQSVGGWALAILGVGAMVVLA